MIAEIIDLAARRISVACDRHDAAVLARTYRDEADMNRFRASIPPGTHPATANLLAALHVLDALKAK
jgi:hypothetical protein